MGALYSKLEQFARNDLDTASDPERPRRKLETTFTTPARVSHLPDPRSATQFIQRTPIFATVTNNENSGGTPKAPKSIARPRYLETDLDDVLPHSVDDLQNPEIDQDPAMTTSTPVHRVQRKVIQVPTLAQDVVESVIEEAIEQLSELRFSDTGVCEVASSEFSSSDQALSPSNAAFMANSSEGISCAEEVKADESQDPSFAEEVIIHPEDVLTISCVDDVVEVVMDEQNDSLNVEVNWSGIGGADRSVGVEGDLSTHFLAYCSQSDISILEDTAQDYPQRSEDSSLALEFVDESSIFSAPIGSESSSNIRSDSMVVHNDSTSFAEPSDGALKWNSSDSLPIVSPPPAYKQPNTEINNKKNIMITPQKVVLKNKTGVRTPLGDVSINSPIIAQQNSTPKLKTDVKSGNDKRWKNIRDERVKLGLDAENTPPHCAFNSYPPDVVHSAPGKLRTKPNKNAATKWSNDSLLI